MGKVVYIHEWKERARLAGKGKKPAIMSPRPRAGSRKQAPRSASDLSAELMRLLMNKKAPRERS